MDLKYNLIPRPHYTDHVLETIDRQMMVFLIGQRRVGKSYILLLLQKELKHIHPDSNIIYINKERYDYKSITNDLQLYEYIVQNLSAVGRNYVLIDEVQDIENYQTALRSLHSENKCQIIATGSNARILSSELSTNLAGRYVEISVYPLSYKEFLLFHNLKDSEESLLNFLRVGGLPGLALFDIDNERQVTDYLQGVLSTVMMKDVVLREKIRNVSFLENLLSFVSDNIGKLFSVRNVANTMRSQGENISELITSSYLSFLRKALLVNPVFRFDIHGKKIFEQIYKFYFTDQGLRNLLAGFNIRGSIEKVMENVVYNQLLIEGYKVYVGELKNSEIDFVAEKGGERLYIQVAYLLASDETVAREFGNLAAIKDNYPKIVVTMDPVGGEFESYPGIRHIRLRDFLLRKKIW